MVKELDSSPNQLIILGNGFDLACGLKSSYSSFFRDRYSLHHWNTESTDIGIINDLLLKSGTLSTKFWKIDSPTIWDIIFLSNCKTTQESETNWCDIETLIQSSIDYWYSEPYWDDYSPGPWTLQYWINGGKEHSDHPEFASYIEDFLIHEGKLVNASAKTFLNELKTQLNQLEKAFGRYLNTYYAFTKFPGQYSNPNKEDERQKQVQNQKIPTYQKYARGLLKTIRGKNIRGNPQLCSVLSFNFTTPFTENAKNNDLVRNIHGITEYPIFGIDPVYTDRDGTTHVITDERSAFTKSFRVLELPTDRRYEKTLHPFRSDEPLDFIKFFGHSLGDADYSYFRTLFDDVDLVNGNTALMFLYTDDSVRTDLNTNVTHLINKYASDLPSQNQRTDLMTKLMLEGRLSILKIQDPKETNQ
ncbi:AbiH family protein [Bifidobacterium sp. ESL0775]|uniref:AbiH family protein n=1 Tax=Bifidobacterium sp. ESL0775 TaxID=2983230 RepID=UPI0023F8BAF7|nr:AbiH family protein [Bifidobacterium sp. ESL0775]WEV69378.1 AbiH family protein [Bifidobacterium sp. ESL0775]